MDYKTLTRVMRRLSLEAGAKIMEIYASDDFEVKVKSDESPVTVADEAAEAAALAGLGNMAVSHARSITTPADGRTLTFSSAGTAVDRPRIVLAADESIRMKRAVHLD